ncbi:MAG: DUF1365 family protein [Bauldia sp.]|nr:DUF1365 family protein [Bauldia sp.]
MRSALYRGIVVHQRTRPKAHRLRYRVFSLLVDLDELPALAGRLRLMGVDRGGLFGFRQADHGARAEGADLRAWVDARLAEAGIAIPGGRVELLCYPRMFGFVFNPLSVFFCRDASGAVAAILYEVANTHGETHTYVIPAAPDRAGVVRQSAEKLFYVSPFLPVGGRYRFRIDPPEAEVGLVIGLDDADGPLLTASFRGARTELTDGALVRALFAYPLMTLKVIAGIHWEALRIWRKGIAYRHHAPAAAPRASSLGQPETGRRAALVAAEAGGKVPAPAPAVMPLAARPSARE